MVRRICKIIIEYKVSFIFAVFRFEKACCAVPTRLEKNAQEGIRSFSKSCQGQQKLTLCLNRELVIRNHKAYSKSEKARTQRPSEVLCVRHSAILLNYLEGDQC